MRSNKFADLVLRASWVIAYAMLIRAFILMKKLENLRRAPARE